NLGKCTAAMTMIHNGLTTNSTHGDDESLTPDDKFIRVTQEPWRAPIIQFFQNVGDKDDPALKNDRPNMVLWKDFYNTFTGAAYQAVFLVGLYYRPTETIDVLRRLVSYAKGKRRFAGMASIRALYEVIMREDATEFGGARGFVLFRTAHALESAINSHENLDEMARKVAAVKRSGKQAELFRETWSLASGGADTPERNKLQIDIREVRMRSKHKGYGHRSETMGEAAD